jgi:hypothetical protein
MRYASKVAALALLEWIASGLIIGIVASVNDVRETAIYLLVGVAIFLAMTLAGTASSRLGVIGRSICYAVLGWALVGMAIGLLNSDLILWTTSGYVWAGMTAILTIDVYKRHYQTALLN